MGFSGVVTISSLGEVPPTTRILQPERPVVGPAIARGAEVDPDALNRGGSLSMSLNDHVSTSGMWISASEVWFW